MMKPNDQRVIDGTLICDVREKEKELISGRAKGGLLATCTPALISYCQEVERDPDRNWVMLRIRGELIVFCYFSPNFDSDTAVRDFWLKAAQWSNQGLEYIVVGDFNARCAINGDTGTNNRGQWMHELTAEAGLAVIRPDAGRFSFQSGRGRSVPDWLLATEGMAQRITRFEIQEDELCGGSDHRPLVWDLRVPMQHIRNPFTRWNIGRLREQEYATAYRGELERSAGALHRRLNQISTELSQDTIDKSYNAILSWINSAMEKSCGWYHHGTRINKNFWTDELGARRTEMVTLTRAAIRAQGPERHSAWEAATGAGRAFRESVKARKTAIFREYTDMLDKPDQRHLFLRMASSRKKRREREVCMLDTSKLDTYADHFTTTFGGEPKGCDEMWDREVLEASTPEAVGTRDLAEGEWSLGLIRRQLRSLKGGKASGPDKIAPEMLKEGEDCMARVLRRLFILCWRTGRVPKPWCEANVTLVFKNKGDQGDIKNYRPISISSVVRRVYEKCLMSEYLSDIDHKLSDTQGGFRRARSTYDQAFVLHELLVTKPHCINAFLDIRAAYDCVDRRIVWTELRNHFGVPYEVICSLRALFDFNRSRLVVNNHKSRQIDNLRGLFQGATISPILFNVFIDSLIRRLNDQGPKISWNGLKTNNLFFADDANIHANTWQEASKLLAICETWSVQAGTEFAPQKCSILARTHPRLYLYGDLLPQEEVVVYLGLPFTMNGFDSALNARTRCDKARKLIFFLRDLGLNAWGWRPKSGLTAIKTFVRPKLEYGLALESSNRVVAKKTEGRLAMAMRMLLSVGKNTSNAALHAFTRLEPMAYRAQELNARYMGRLQNSRDASIPAVACFYNRLSSISRNSDSLVAHFRFKNSLHQELDLLPPLFNRPTRTPERPPKDPMPAPARKKTRIKAIHDLQEQGTLDPVTGRRSGAIGRAIPVPDLKTPALIRHAACYDRDDVRRAILWRLGRIATHQPCHNCVLRLQASRAHAIDCAAITASRFQIEGLRDVPGENVLDKVLNWIDTQVEPQPVVMRHLSWAISKIQRPTSTLRPTPCCSRNISPLELDFYTLMVFVVF